MLLSLLLIEPDGTVGSGTALQRRSQEFDLGGYKWVKETKQPHKTI